MWAYSVVLSLVIVSAYTVSSSATECGVSAKSSEWLVKVQAKSGLGLKCFGVLVSKNHVLTNAICVENLLNREIEVTFQYDFYDKPFTASPTSRTHANFTREGLVNNLVIMEMGNKLERLPNVNPICLYKKVLQADDFKNFTFIEALGENEENEKISQFFDIKKGFDCMDEVDGAEEKNYFDYDHICATYRNPMTSTCLRGFGAPLQTMINGRWYLLGLYNIGLISKNVSQPCSDNGVISFTEVAKHLHFIYEEMGQLENTAPNRKIRSIFSYPDCGPTFSNSKPLLAHGERVGIEYFPWMAAIYIGESSGLTYVCGGSLISRNLILTAAHCIRDGTAPSDILVILGRTHTYRDWNKDILTAQFRGVKKMILHEQYKTSDVYHDIALLRLTHPVNITDQVKPICIWTETKGLERILNKEADVAGWGYLGNTSDARDLQFASFLIRPWKNCSEIKVNHEPGHNEKVICVGRKPGSQASPNVGDSGGPLVMVSKGRSFVRGIVSHAKLNADKLTVNLNYSTLFSDVAHHREWITENSDHEIDFDYTD